ncbi:MAP kinase-activated protein kinase 2 (Fragment) [Seminavis robusta]|uniref:MAP kinase-activated protein kinase 2 n=1 Tax=Seminavis robusta TaxID=568900 RepID=A0A9N8ERS0_9STRA
MWKGKAKTILQRAIRTGTFPGQTRSQWWPVGAAVSLLVLAELDRQSKNNARSNNEHENANKNMTLPLENSRWFPSMTSSCEALQQQQQQPHVLPQRKSADLRRFRTLRRMDENSTKDSMDSRYDVDWDSPLGEGSFGAVYVATDRRTGEKVAVKKISKMYTNEDEFYREMAALLHISKAGGHPGICSLREHFNEKGHYILILDLVSGGEMFDHLVEQGAYSEADAARLIREVASSLYFIHGLNLTHGDLKPENLMLSSKNPSDAVIKLVDFGCAHIHEQDSNKQGVGSGEQGGIAGKTLAYCPPEALREGPYGRYVMRPSMDLWSLGIILYIMLTGMHPFDIRGQATDEEVAKAIVSGVPPPLRDSPITAHLSASAVDLIERLMDPNPKTRMDALSLLQHPWVKGETALTDKMRLAGKKLSIYHGYKSGIQRTVFENLVTGSDNLDDSSSRKSLVEKSFRWFDSEEKGHIDLYDLQSVHNGVSLKGFSETDAAPLSLSAFSELLSDHMQNRYFPKGHVVYREGDVGNKMYFISSGNITVSTKTGFTVQRGSGDFFGEGALLSPKKIRSATIHCNTPVHAMEVSREYFDKYLAKSDSALYLFLREKDIIRKKNRAKMILRLQKTLNEREFQFGETLFEFGDTTDSMFLMEKGEFDILVGDQKVFSAQPGNLCGENSVLTRRPRSATAICATESGCTVYEMQGRDFRKLMRRAPDIKASLHNLCMRRDFKKAVVMRLNKEFPYQNPREAFDAVKTDTSRPHHLSKEEVANLMREFYSSYSDKEVSELIRTMDLTGSGTVSFDEFKKVFIASKKGSEAK